MRGEGRRREGLNRLGSRVDIDGEMMISGARGGRNALSHQRRREEKGKGSKNNIDNNNIGSLDAQKRL